MTERKVMPCDQHEPSSDPSDDPRADALSGRQPDPRPESGSAATPEVPVAPGSPTVPAPRASPDADMVPLRLRNPVDFLAALPYLVTQPLTDAVVVLVLGDGKVQGVLYNGLDHLDRVLPPARSGVAAVRAALAADATAMLVAGFGQPARVTPHVSALRSEARARGMPVLEALRVTDGRYWSYICRNHACCPAEGRLFDPGVSTVPAEAVLRGLVPGGPAETDRARGLLEPVHGALRAAVAEAVAAEEALVAREDTETALVNRWIPEVRGALRREEKDRVTEPAALARLGVHLTELRVRDDMWTRIVPETAEVHVRLWSRVTRHVPERLRPAPAALLAVAAWQYGDQRLAKAALDAALSVDPRYSMAVLMSRALSWGLPAERWRGFVAERRDAEPDGDDDEAGPDGEAWPDGEGLPPQG
ncbi:DUF4192 domain-containing protein [Nocardiopsis nanhaiensis]